MKKGGLIFFVTDPTRKKFGARPFSIEMGAVYGKSKYSCAWALRKSSNLLVDPLEMADNRK